MFKNSFVIPVLMISLLPMACGKHDSKKEDHKEGIVNREAKNDSSHQLTQKTCTDQHMILSADGKQCIEQPSIDKTPANKPVSDSAPKKENTPENKPVTKLTQTDCAAINKTLSEDGKTCVEKKPSVSTGNEQPVSVETPDPLGSWTMCKTDGENSISSKWTFDGKGNLTYLGKQHKDKACKESFTAESIDTIKAEWIKVMIDRGYSAEYAATFAEGKAVDMRGKTIHGTYLVGKMLTSSSRAINLKLGNSNTTTYLSYMIDGNTLKIAGACREISEDMHCKAVSGDSEGSRAIDFNTSKTIVAIRI